MTWIFILFGFVVLATMAYAAWSAAPWVPTKRHDIDRMISLCGVKAGERFFELGCGDGRVCCAVAQKTGADVVGVELSLLQWFAAIVRKVFSRCPMHVVFGDIFHVDLTKADVVYFFLMPRANAKLGVKLKKEMKSGSRAVSYVFPVSGMEPSVIDRPDGKLPLYLYRF